jgi:hypothetical protein
MPSSASGAMLFDPMAAVCGGGGEARRKRGVGLFSDGTRCQMSCLGSTEPVQIRISDRAT